MAEPLVSVIVTTYNREEYLKETLKSILAQTFTDFELIVVDNFSNYDFFHVIEEMGDARIRPFQNRNNGIIAVNRNYGLSKAVGKYVAFCDDDDLWENNKLELQVSYASRNPGVIIGTGASYIDADGNYIQKAIPSNYRNVKHLLLYNHLFLSSVLIDNCEILFDESNQYVAMEDHALWLKMVLKGFSIHIIQSPLLRYRLSTSSVSNQKKNSIPARRIAMISHIYADNSISFVWYCIAVCRNLCIILVRRLKQIFCH